ncbi:serine/threonine-protein kinase OSR1-like [Pyrus ussuriensis x Pyrus communis]|uniref:Serine/threonine-protein kinase OSR1-like n=1 Tax=Pyrus ussuriensis x Pyrus communis TaxID=2448454 RepID=A0A5N5G2M8_9ROSA|nr:serine/threonine-protein kinase OSR1-like [Pyrus ussuriensis x Pyrus communis]
MVMLRFPYSSPKDTLNGFTLPSVIGTSASIIPAVHCILQKHTMQKVHIESHVYGFCNRGVLESHVIIIQQRIDKPVEVLRIRRTKNAKLEKRLSALAN